MTSNYKIIIFTSCSKIMHSMRKTDQILHLPVCLSAIEGGGGCYSKTWFVNPISYVLRVVSIPGSCNRTTLYIHPTEQSNRGYMKSLGIPDKFSQGDCKMCSSRQILPGISPEMILVSCYILVSICLIVFKCPFTKSTRNEIFE